MTVDCVILSRWQLDGDTGQPVMLRALADFGGNIPAGIAITDLVGSQQPTSSPNIGIWKLEGLQQVHFDALQARVDVRVAWQVNSETLLDNRANTLTQNQWDTFVSDLEGAFPNLDSAAFEVAGEKLLTNDVTRAEAAVKLINHWHTFLDLLV